LAIGYIKIGIQAYEGADEDLSWNIYNQFGKGILSRYILGSIVVGLIVYCGFLLLFIPGFILYLMYFFTDYILVEKKVRITKALAISNNITSGIKWSLFGSGFLVSLLAVAVYVPLTLLKTQIGFYYYPIDVLISPIISTFISLIFIYFYKDLSAQQENLDTLSANTEEPLPPLPLEMLMHQD
jgi:hypothetical protein